VELFRKKDSRFYWYDFKVRGKRYRGSTKETNKKRAGRIAALRFSQAIEGTGLLDRKAPSLHELSTRFRIWVESAGLASKTRKYYANGWRLLSSTSIVGMRLDHITKDHVEVLRFGGSAANLNCALRTLHGCSTREKSGINGRELYRIRTENLDWNNRIIFVPDSKTVDGRRMIPMSDRAYRCSEPAPQVRRKDGCFLPLVHGVVI
jgi:integrase